MTPSLTPQARSILASLEGMGLPPLHTLTPSEARWMRTEAAQLAASPAVEPVSDVHDEVISGADGALEVRIYEPAGWVPGAGSMAYFHGGGWVLGDLDTHDALCRGLANASGFRVMATHYRRAPEARHPAAIEDAWTATTWLAQEESGPLLVGGDSCGGHMATVVAARSRTSGMALAAQLLVYPVTDLGRFDRPSYDTFAEGFWLTRASMAWFRGHYLPQDADVTDPDVSPLRREDLHAMPPAVVVAAGCDVLLDEGLAYAERLREAGGLVAYQCWDGVIHGFVAMPDAFPEAREALRWASGELRRLTGVAT
jgi:acetyl esterase